MLILGAMIGMAGRSASATEVVADTFTGNSLPTALGPVGATATTSLYAYSIQTGTVAPAGPNALVFGANRHSGPGPVTIVPIVMEGVAGGVTPKIRVPHPPSGVPISSGPPLAVQRNIPKSNLASAGDMDSLTSASGDYSGTATQFERVVGFPIATGTVKEIQAKVETSPTRSTRIRQALPGNAAAMAEDPFTVAGGSSYAYLIGADVSINIDEAPDRAGALVFATDSNLFTTDSLDNFVEDGEPLNDALWTLEVSGDGLIDSTAELGIDFELNPLAPKEINFPTAYLTSLPGYSAALTPDELAPLIDEEFDGRVRDAMLFSSGSASLTGFSVFPDGTTYTPLNGIDDTYLDGVAAAVEAPEPSGLAVAGIALPAFAWFRRRGRGHGRALQPAGAVSGGIAGTAGIPPAPSLKGRGR
ncbi:MAG: hypothetical protein ACHRHE_24120, partial [Tepidisphaerales bacterium]